MFFQSLLSCFSEVRAEIFVLPDYDILFFTRAKFLCTGEFLHNVKIIGLYRKI